MIQIRASSADRPRPLYYSTALNLGLHKARGQPCLLDSLLPPASPLPARRWLRRLLLLPPPPATAVAVHRACAVLQRMGGSLPLFPMVPAAAVVLKLRTREANDTFFREAGELCLAIQVCGGVLCGCKSTVLSRCVAALRSLLCLLYRDWRALLPVLSVLLLQDLLSRDDDALPELSAALLELACREMGVGLDRERLRQGCAAALQAIHEGEVGDGGVTGWEVGQILCSSQHTTLHLPPALNCSGGSRHAAGGWQRRVAAAAGRLHP